MKFNEKDFIEVDLHNNVLIYFLLDDDDNVVYVGQTKNGIVRPLSHKRSKDFSRVFIKYTKEEELDKEENKYIVKYQPKYNNQLNLKYVNSTKSCAVKVKEVTGIRVYSGRMLEKDIKKIGKENEIMYFKGSGHISLDFLEEMIQYKLKELNDEQ